MINNTIELESILMLFSIIAIFGSWIGAWFAVKSLLKIHNHRLDDQKEMLLKHDIKIGSHSEKIAFIEANMERRA